MEVFLKQPTWLNNAVTYKGAMFFCFFFLLTVYEVKYYIRDTDDDEKLKP